MNEGRVSRHYGFGAARIGLCPEPYAPEPPESLRNGLSRALREWGNGGLLRDAASVAPAALLGLILLAAFAVTFAQSRRDETDVDLVLLASSQPEPTPELPPPPTPRPRLEPPPPAPEPVVEEPPPPPPPPVARPKPTPAPPTPPKPPAPSRPRAAPRPEPPPAARPQPAVAVPALAAAPRPVQPDPTPRARRRPAPSRSEALPPPPGLSAPDERPDFDVAKAPARSARPSRALPASSARRPVPALAVASAPLLDPGETAAARRSGPAAPAPRPSERARPRLALPGSSPAAAAPRPAQKRMARAEAPAPSPPAAAPRSEDPRLNGVPLASLASCVSDREEDTLKQRVIAAVKSPAECASPAGRYRFLETKNLNAFLMWVERASSRKKADRCVELALALDCLDRRRARGSRGSRG